MCKAVKDTQRKQGGRFSTMEATAGGMSGIMSPIARQGENFLSPKFCGVTRMSGSRRKYFFQAIAEPEKDLRGTYKARSERCCAVSRMFTGRFFIFSDLDVVMHQTGRRVTCQQAGTFLNCRCLLPLWTPLYKIKMLEFRQCCGTSPGLKW